MKEETKSKSSIGDLKDANGDTKTEDKDKAEILNDFFASVLLLKEIRNYLTLSQT